MFNPRAISEALPGVAALIVIAWVVVAIAHLRGCV